MYGGLEQTNRVKKLQRLLRFHRQNVFGESGEAHGRAIDRLKRSKTFKAMCEAHEEQARIRTERHMTALDY